MSYPKFIITQDGHLRLGMVSLHKHLMERGDVCLGGGYWQINHYARQVELSGASSDYGRPQWHIHMADKRQAASLDRDAAC